MNKLLAVVLVGFGLTGPVPAATAFSNLGAGDSYDCCYGWAIYGSAAPIKLDKGSRFVPPSSYTLDSVQAAFNWYGGTAGGYLWLMSDTAGAPGAILESFHFASLPAPSAAKIVTGTSTLHPLLSAGLQYWVVASADSDSFLGFGWNTTGDTGLASRDSDGPWGVMPWATAGAFRVTGTLAPIPEPEATSLMLIGLGLLGLVAHREKGFVHQ